jgi:RNA polymerase sigma-70 factor (ECF subfamily)
MTSAAGMTNVRALRRSAADAGDGELIERIGWGDREAFEVLYRRYARPVLGLALHRLGDRGRAEDAVQETFAKIWRRAATYRPERGPGAPWLYGVARHTIADQGRSARVDPVSEPPERADDEPGPPEQVESEWVSWRVHRAVDALPSDERLLIELAYWKGLSQSEIADELGIPLGTVKTRTRRTLARLAELLDDES